VVQPANCAVNPQALTSGLLLPAAADCLRLPLLQIAQTQAMLANEYGTASNIKSRVNRQSVLAAITSAQQRLKLYTKVGLGMCGWWGRLCEGGQVLAAITSAQQRLKLYTKVCRGVEPV